MYLLDSNCAPCFSFHSSLLDRIICNHSILFCAIWPLIPYAMSSINSNARSEGLGISKNSVLYSMNRIGDNDDPYGIPISMFILLDIVPLNRICVDRSIRKLCTSLTICKEIRLCFMLWINRL